MKQTKYSILFVSIVAGCGCGAAHILWNFNKKHYAEEVLEFRSNKLIDRKEHYGSEISVFPFMSYGKKISFNNAWKHRTKFRHNRFLYIDHLSASYAALPTVYVSKTTRIKSSPTSGTAGKMPFPTPSTTIPQLSSSKAVADKTKEIQEKTIEDSVNKMQSNYTKLTTKKNEIKTLSHPKAEKDVDIDSAKTTPNDYVAQKTVAETQINLNKKSFLSQTLSKNQIDDLIKKQNSIISSRIKAINSKKLEIQNKKVEVAKLKIKLDIKQKDFEHAEAQTQTIVGHKASINNNSDQIKEEEGKLKTAEAKLTKTNLSRSDKDLHTREVRTLTIALENMKETNRQIQDIISALNVILAKEVAAAEAAKKERDEANKAKIKAENEQKILENEKMQLENKNNKSKKFKQMLEKRNNVLASNISALDKDKITYPHKKRAIRKSINAENNIKRVQKKSMI